MNRVRYNSRASKMTVGMRKAGAFMERSGSEVCLKSTNRSLAFEPKNE